MQIYKNKKDNKLYLIYKVSPPRYTGSWYEAVPCGWNGEKKKHNTINDFVVVGQRW